MATANSSRVTRTIVRSRGNRPRSVHPSLARRRKPADEPLISKTGLGGRDLQGQIVDIIQRLRVVGSVAVTAEVALRAQNCEQDADIAECLRHGVVDALTAQIERMSRLCAPVAGMQHE